MVHTPKEFSHAAMKFAPSIITVYLPRSVEIVEPESIHQAPSIPDTLSIHKFAQQINDRGDCSREFFKTEKPFTLNGKTKLTLFMVTTSPMKAITSVQCAGDGIQKTGVNG